MPAKRALPIFQVTEETAIEPDHIYVVSPGYTMTLVEGMLSTVAARDPLARRTSIDAFFISLAEARGGNCGCALLSGAGTDGTIGLTAVKEAGGLTVAQLPETAEYDSMLLSAVRTGLVDHQLLVEEMAHAFTEFLVRRAPSYADIEIGDGNRFQVCEAIRRITGHDFSGYKTTTIDRRLRRRMQMLRVDSIDEYVEHVGTNRSESNTLLRDMLIGVTQFFRDPECFDALAEQAIPKILEGRTEDDEVRIWVPGCSTGEEAYSLAIMLHEKAAHLDSVPRLRVFGSDIDENALHAARLGRYPKGIEADMSPERLEGYFDAEDGTYCIRSHIRDICLFAQHNVLNDPPFSRIDLVSFRNVLIYMNPTLQQQLLPVFHYALRQGGFLFLGPAENATQHPTLFSETDRRCRIYRRIVGSSRLPAFPLAAGGYGDRAPPSLARTSDVPVPPDLSARAARRILASFAPAYIVVDRNYEILDASVGTGRYLELPSGRPRTSLAAMARSGLALDIKTAIGLVIATGEPVSRKGIAIGTEPDRRRVSIAVERLSRHDSREQLFLVVFRDEEESAESVSSISSRGDDEVARALESELQTTKERLQGTLEELETSNQELKATNEEISSVNEELQSSNEELETSKEELQSLNEELRTVNAELHNRVDDLSRTNNDLKNLLANTRIAMLFLAPDLRIMNFTPPAKPLFRLRDHDVGRPLYELAGPVSYPELRPDILSVVATGDAVERELQPANGDHRTFLLRILPYRDTQDQITGAVLAFLDVTEFKRSEERLAAMVSELNHRVKNTLATVQSIVRQTQAGSNSVEDFGAALQGRLHAMGATHNLLSDASWKHADLRKLAEEILTPFSGRDGDRLLLGGPGIELRPEHAVSIGMIFAELGTNAAKYGAWSVPGGTVELTWKHVQSDGDALELTWAEAGGPAVTKPEKEGFGLRFIRHSTQYSLHGSYNSKFRKEGFACTFELPASRIA
ncbi:MAG: CheR family methyltransferase [Rhodospirillaceae bacterium]